MKAISWLLNLAVVATAIMAFYTIGPLLETKLFPVYSKFKILEVKQGDGLTFTIEIRKLRDCAPQGWAWYTTDLGGYIQQLDVAPRRQQTPKMPLGKHLTTFKITEIAASDIPSLYAETFSNCHPFWVTRSVVFP